MVNGWLTTNGTRGERLLTSRNYRDFYEKFSIGIYRSSPDGRQLRANPALMRLNGYDSEEDYHAVMGDLTTEWYVDPNRRAQFEQLLLANGFVENFVSKSLPAQNPRMHLGG